MTTTDFASKARKALHAAQLALSAERLGNLEEADTAARTCGRIAHGMGLILKTVWEDLLSEGIVDAPRVWGAVVDGWHDAAER